MTTTIMNTTVSKLVTADLYNHNLANLAANNIAGELLQPLITFLLASISSSLLGSRHHIRYGVFCASLSIWRVSVALLSVVTLSTLALVVPSLSQYLHATAAPQVAYLRNYTDHRTSDFSQHGLQQDGPEAEDSFHEDIPTQLHHFKPLFFPSRTTHRRLHPKPHTFNYSYLLVGTPVLRKSINHNSMLSTHPTSSNRNFDQSTHFQSTETTAWFSVHASDYLQRSPAYNNLTLRDKLDIYLRSQGISNPEDTLPYAYLVTAPRFLGFSFNPVSFWYLYDAKQNLKAMILEVNNTFDERRMYFLYQDNYGGQRTNDEIAIQSKDGSINPKTARFTNTWKKDFHVSPFNDRDGTYSVSATDILRTGQLDVTIVLSEDTQIDNDNEKTTTSTVRPDSLPQQSPPTTQSSPKIIARIYHPSSSPPINPSTLSSTQQLLFTTRHGLTGLLTNPRILLEARKLWTMGLTVFYRPEPFRSTIPRVETCEEVVVEGRFRALLGTMVGSDGVGVRVGYVAAAGIERGVEVALGSKGKKEQGSEQEAIPALRIHVLTPTFYTELAKSSDDLQRIFDNFGFNAPEKEKLVDCSSTELLRVLLGRVSSLGSNGRVIDDGDYTLQNLSSKYKEKNGDFMVRILQRLVYQLRVWTSYGLSSVSSAKPDSTLKSRPLSSTMSPFDRLVQVGSTPPEYETYIRAVLLILLADRFALGSVGLLRIELRVLRFMVVLTVVNLGMWVARSVLRVWYSWV